MTKAHKTELKDVIKKAISKASDFVSKKSIHISKLLTKEIHTVTNQFLTFKQRTKE